MDKKLYSQLISLIRTPLLFLVVYIHSYDPFFSSSCYNFFVTLIPSGISSVAVPSFFFISGFLFFFNLDCFNKEIYYRKILKRLKSLLVPYILWNIIYLLFRFILESMFKDFLSGNSKSVFEYDFTDYLSIFWISDVQTFPSPNDGPLWYLRNLIIVTIFSYYLYYIVKYTKALIVVVLGVGWFSYHSDPFVCQLLTSFFYFSLGAFAAIQKIDFLGLLENKRIYLYACFLSLLLLTFNEDCCGYVRYPMTLVGVFVVFIIAYRITKKYPERKLFSLISQNSFFIYALHFIFCQALLRLCSKFINLSDISFTCISLTLPFIVVYLCNLIAVSLTKVCPKFYTILNGGR